MSDLLLAAAVFIIIATFAFTVVVIAAGLVG
jgi:hypothetical protein